MWVGCSTLSPKQTNNPKKLIAQINIKHIKLNLNLYNDFTAKQDEIMVLQNTIKSALKSCNKK
jgi:hypothetical protein